MALFWRRKDSKDEFGIPSKEKTGETESSALESAAPSGTIPSLTPASPWPSSDKPAWGSPTAPPAPEPQVPQPFVRTDPDSALQQPKPVVAAPDPTPPGGLFGRMKSALSDRLQKTKEEFVGKIREVIKAAGVVDENLIERIEELLIQGDVGAETTMRIVEEMKEFEARGASTDELLKSFKKQFETIIGTDEKVLTVGTHKPLVILVIGVNGVGKTTTIGKLAAEFRAQGKKVVLVAGDTFRAAAIDQLKIWADRTESIFIDKGMGSDPSGTAFDGVQAAIDQGADVVLLDTAGRLHTKTNLMEELKKVVRVCDKVLPGAPHETLLVLDATTGQNAIQQAKVFTESVPVTGIIMTKLDGTAKGGVLIGIRNLFKIPVIKIGVGEGVEDLRDFKPQEFVAALFAE